MRSKGCWRSNTLAIVLLVLICTGLVLPASAQRSEREMRERGDIMAEPVTPVEPAEAEEEIEASGAIGELPSPSNTLLGAGVASPPSFPSSYYGTAKLGGTNMDSGLFVTAWVDNVRVARTSPLLWEGDTVSSLDVLADGDNVNAPSGKGGTDGDTVRFKIGGTWANETGTWTGGDLSNVDLTAIPYSTEYANKSIWLSDWGANCGWHQQYKPRLLGDVNGDSLADIVGFADRSAFVSLSTGSGFSKKAVWIQDWGIIRGWDQVVKPRLLGDVDGDGRDDIVGFADKSTFVSLSTGTSFAPKTVWVQDWGRNRGWDQITKPRLLGDVDGDGRDDIVGFADRSTFVSLSTGTSFTPKSVWISDWGSNNGWHQTTKPRFLADVNGDGLDDIVGFADNSAFVSLSTGSSFAPKSVWIQDWGKNRGWEQEYKPRLMADADGDGRVDIIGFSYKSTFVSLSTSTSFAAKSVWIEDWGSSRGWNQTTKPRMLADASGDGRMDIIGFADRSTFSSSASY